MYYLSRHFIQLIYFVYPILMNSTGYGDHLFICSTMPLIINLALKIKYLEIIGEIV